LTSEFWIQRCSVAFALVFNGLMFDRRKFRVKEDS